MIYLAKRKADCQVSDVKIGELIFRDVSTRARFSLANNYCVTM